MTDNWVLERLRPLANERLVLLADPQRMIRSGSRAVDDWACGNGFTVMCCSGNLALREMYEQVRDEPAAKVILVNRCRESAKLPLFYPDLECRCPPRARLTLTLRDFLIERTGDGRWPSRVNDRNWSRLLLDNLPQALDAHRQLREVDGSRFTDSDFYKIVLGATLGVNPFRSLTPSEIRRLCIESHARLEEVRGLFAADAGEDAGRVLEALRSQIALAERPWCWMLDGDPHQVVRAFTLAAILHQHELEYGVLLDNFEPGLGRYQDIPRPAVEQTIKDMLRADPDRMAADVAEVERFLAEEPDKRLAFLLDNRCRVTNPQVAQKVLLAEKLSPLVRSVALLSLLADLLIDRNLPFHSLMLDLLDREGAAGGGELSIAAKRPTPQWATLLATYRRAIEFLKIGEKLKDHARRLKVVPAEGLTFESFHEIWAKDRACRLDYYSCELKRVVRVGDILPLPKSAFWPELAQRWERAGQRLAEAVQAVDHDLDEVNAKFQDLYVARYTDWIKRDDAPAIFTHQFVPRFLKPHWDPAGTQKAVILIFDGLRVDSWEELVRPVLEEKYEVMEERPGSSILPSETQLSRKAISAGCLPVHFVCTSENGLLENALRTHMNLTVKFAVEKSDDDAESGISARYTSPLIDVVIFNFTDKNLHHCSQDLSFIYNTTVRGILREDVRSVVRDLPADALVFVTSDHGFTPVPEPEFQVPHQLVTDAGDVKYRVGRLKQPLEARDRNRGVTFRVNDMGVPDRTGRAAWTFNHLLFPRPGFTLRRPQGRHAPERYTHGGLSMAECLIPMVMLGPKASEAPAFELTDLRVQGLPAEGEELEIVVTAGAASSVAEDILFQLEASLDEVQPRKEVFRGDRQEYAIRWRPATDKPTADELQAGVIVRNVTVVASYRWHGRLVRSSRHARVEIKLDPSRIRRRLDRRLDSIMGMVPRGLK